MTVVNCLDCTSALETSAEAEVLISWAEKG